MKKMEYLAPEMETVELKMNNTLLAGSAGTEEVPGMEDPEED